LLFLWNLALGTAAGSSGFFPIESNLAAAAAISGGEALSYPCFYPFNANFNFSFSKGTVQAYNLYILFIYTFSSTHLLIVTIIQWAFIINKNIIFCRFGNTYTNGKYIGFVIRGI
jgi:hypothetical protein